MSPIQWTRVIIGGLLAGVVINVLEFLVNDLALGGAWSDAMRALNRPPAFTGNELVAFNLWGFLIGISAVALYAVIRDHFGPGIRTAIYAGLGIWAVGYLFAAIPSLAMHLFPRALVIYGVILGLFETVVGTVAGAWFYRPAELHRRITAT